MFVSKSSDKIKHRIPNILRKKSNGTTTHVENVKTSKSSTQVTISKPVTTSILKPNTVTSDQSKIILSQQNVCQIITFANVPKNSVIVSDVIKDCTNNNANIKIVFGNKDLTNGVENISKLHQSSENIRQNIQRDSNVQIIKNEGQSVSPIAITPPVFKCDFGECQKEFSTSQKLKKHKARHNKVKIQQVQNFICPAKSGDDVCNRVYQLKQDLVKHLNEEHTLNDAAYSCEDCSRAFFWPLGLRAHRRACMSAGRSPLVCTWEGCGRTFMQPCRLREHTRAHTGDRPYPCLYPNCNWSFRTASKLLRHTHRHTGERRHKCAECGAQFLRGEHLREHLQRHQRSHNTKLLCNKQGCLKKFSDLRSLRAHHKSVHFEMVKFRKPFLLKSHVFTQPTMVRSFNSDILAKYKINELNDNELSDEDDKKQVDVIYCNANDEESNDNIVAPMYNEALELSECVVHEDNVETVILDSGKRLVPVYRSEYSECDKEIQTNNLICMIKNPKIECDEEECSKPLTDIQLLKIHSDSFNSDAPEVTFATNEKIEAEWNKQDDPFMISQNHNEDCDNVVHNAMEWRAARTHCTWPLKDMAHIDREVFQHDDVPVELSEGSESNASTIKSDLFLHGNVLNNDDNESCCVRTCEDSDSQCGESTLMPAPIEADLGLSTIDLMQDELMYTDTAVDESSFQVMLLSDNDLN